MKKLIQQIRIYISENRVTSSVIGGVLFIIILACVFTIRASSVKNNTEASPTPTPSRIVKKRSPDKKTSPTPTKKVATDTSIGIKTTITPTSKPTSTSQPTATNTPTPQSPTSSPTPTATHTPTPLPPDTTPPSMMEMTGPPDGSTITFRGFCFPMKPVDDRSTYPQIQTQYKFDSAEWSGWGTEISPCYTDVQDGPHTFSVQLKDEAGNVSSTISRTFTVDADE